MERIARRSAGPQVWVLGAHGMLGVAVCHAMTAAGHAVSGLVRAQLDAHALQPSALPVLDGDVVVNCIGLVNRRLATLDEAAFLRVNALWPRLLADLCQAHQAHLIHVSTDCVFSGADGPHDESASPDADDVYGRSKALGEPMNACVVRSSIVGPELRNHYSLLCWLLGHDRGATVPGYVNHLWNGVTTLQMGHCLARVIDLGLHRRPGVLHLHSNDVSKFELLSMMNRHLRGDLIVKPVAAEQARDMRLRTVDPGRLRKLDVSALDDQIAALTPLCSPRGHWIGPVPA